MAETLESYVNKEIKKGVDDTDLMKEIGADKATMVSYTDLVNHKDLRELMNSANDNNVVVFFPVDSKLDGHYVAMLYYPEDDLLNYFCPYGFSPSQDVNHSTYLDGTDPRVRTSLLNMISDFQMSGGRVDVNTFKFQDIRSSSATCGRHCFMRIRFKLVQEPGHYARFLKYRNMTADEIVTIAFI
jgi:hypothetical protein